MARLIWELCTAKRERERERKNGYIRREGAQMKGKNYSEVLGGDFEWRLALLIIQGFVCFYLLSALPYL